MTQSNGDVDHGLKRALDFAPQGLAVFDAALALLACNARYSQLLALPPNMTLPGTGLYEIALFLAMRGDLGFGNPAQLAKARVEALTTAPLTVSQRLSETGQTLEIHTTRVPEGGLVISFADVTARVAAERELERVNLSLEARVAERTAALTRANAELEAARAKADAANHDKTRFLAAASHDLVQPLNAARLYTASLVERVGEGELRDLAGSIEASLNAVEEIMSTLLDISRIDSGALKPMPVAFDVAELLRKVEVEFQPLAGEKSVTLTTVRRSGAVLADRMLVARIVQNLVSNAVKYTPQGGRVLVGCRRRGARLRLDIIDTGIGFNKDQRALLFAEFSRLERGARMAQGLGLGLSIVERLVNAMGLTLELDSVEGRGSRFSLYLPLTRNARAAVPATDPDYTTDWLAGVRVLCVDNEAAIVEAMATLLSGWGCDVRSARSLKEIDRRELLLGWLPDLVLIDYHLDQTSGLDAIEWLRHNIGGHLPAALVTADRSPAVRTLAEDRGIAVVIKPVKPAALRAAIGRLVRRQIGAQAGSLLAENSASN